MEVIRYKGKGEHSVRELELIIEQKMEELYLINSGQKQLRIGGVMRSDCELEKLVNENREYILGFYTGDELKKYLSNNYA